MRRVSKRLLAMLSVLCMTVCFMPVTSGVAFASEGVAATLDASSIEVGAENVDQVGQSQDVTDFDKVDKVGGSIYNRDLIVSDQIVMDGSTIYDFNDGAVIPIKSKFIKGTVTYEPATNTLTLKNAKIQGANVTFSDALVYTGIFYKSRNLNDFLTIKVIGSNTITSAGLKPGFEPRALFESNENIQGILFKGTNSKSKLTVNAPNSELGSRALHTPYIGLDSVKVYANAGYGQMSIGAYIPYGIEFVNKAQLYGKASADSNTAGAAGVYFDSVDPQGIGEGCVLDGKTVVKKNSYPGEVYGVYKFGELENYGTLSGTLSGTGTPEYAYGIYCQALRTVPKTKTTGTSISASVYSTGITVEKTENSYIGGAVTAKCGKASAAYAFKSYTYAPLIVAGEDAKLTLANANGTPTMDVDLSCEDGLFAIKTAKSSTGKSAKYVTDMTDLSYMDSPYMQVIPTKITVKDVTWTKDLVLNDPVVTVKVGSSKAAFTYSVNGDTMGYDTIYIKGDNGKIATNGYLSTTYDIYPSGVDMISVVAGKGCIDAEWAKATNYYQGGEGFELRYSTSSSMKNAVVISNIDYYITQKTIEGLKKGKTYYVQVRTLNKCYGDTYYSPWSKAKKATVK